MRRERPLSAKDGITGEKWPVNLACDSDFHVNLRHGTDSFTSPPKEGMLWNFSPEKSDGFGRVFFNASFFRILYFVVLVLDLGPLGRGDHLSVLSLV
jgi:hypothetical protein